MRAGLERLPAGLGDLAILVSVVLLALSLLSVYFFAGLDIPTALAILGVVDRTQLLLATTIVAVPPALGGYLLGLVARRRLRVFKGVTKTPAKAVVTLLAVMIGSSMLLATVTLLGLVIFGGMVLAIGVLGRLLLGRGGSPPGRVSEAEWFYILCLVVALTVLTAVGRAWTPTERLVLRQGEPFVGHVIGSDEGRQLLISRKNRRALWVPAENIVDRQICLTDKRSVWLSPLSRLLQRDQYPSCD